MSEFKCPSCGGTASIAYHRSGDNLLHCQDCQKTFSERYAKIREQASRIAELEENIRQAKNCVEMVAANPRWTKIVKIYSGLALEVLKGAGK